MILLYRHIFEKSTFFREFAQNGDFFDRCVNIFDKRKDRRTVKVRRSEDAFVKYYEQSRMMTCEATTTAISAKG